jgi:hypothetical protein
MTLTARNRITYLLFSISLVVNGALLVFFASHYGELETHYPLSETYQAWWFLSSKPLLSSFPLELLGGVILAALSLTGSLSLIFAFKYSSSQEIFYVQLFLLSLSFFSLRYLSYLVPYFHLPLSYTAAITRTVLFFRY